MILRIEQDHNRFKQIVRGRIRKNLKKYITRGELIGRKGKDLISIPLPQIDLPRFVFDPKETGALVAWLSYAGYLHTRIAHGWSGRSSAYFALLGFLLVIFTYLGVSYILPGLHAYA